MRPTLTERTARKTAGAVLRPGNASPGRQIEQGIAVGNDIGDRHGESEQGAAKADRRRQVAGANQLEFMIGGDIHINQQKNRQ